MADMDPGRYRESDALALKWFQTEGRAIFVRPEEWNPEAGVPGTLAGDLLRDRERSRDMALLACLGQHHYLTTAHVHALFYRQQRNAQKRMRKLEELDLVVR